MWSKNVEHRFAQLLNVMSYVHFVFIGVCTRLKNMILYYYVILHIFIMYVALVKNIGGKLLAPFADDKQGHLSP